MKILFSGGGTLGSVTPLMAIKDMLDGDDFEFSWIGTKDGPEKRLVKQENINFRSISSGKLRRYWSLKNFTDLFRFVFGLFQSFLILRQEKPDVCITTGGYVSVPVHIAAWILGIKSWVHQQDVQPGWANRIMAKFATKVTTATQDSIKYFPKDKTECIGNPVRKEIYSGSKDRAREVFNLREDRPVIFVVGGGTGAREINNLIGENIEGLVDLAQIIHITGPERDDSKAKKLEQEYQDYHTYKFLDEEMKHVYAVADLVICRAGFGTLTELVALKKPAILVPKEGHQEKNADYFKGIEGVKLSSNNLNKKVKKLIKRKQVDYKEKMSLLNKKETKKIVFRLLNS